MQICRAFFSFAASKLNIMEENLKPEKTPEEKKNTRIGCLILIVIAAIVIWFFYPAGEKSAQMDAYSCAQTMVKRNLKSPSTAQFPTYKEAVITKLGEGKYEVKAYVDAQNSFGAMIRNDFTAIIRMNEKRDKWNCDYFEMGGVQYK